MPQPEREPVRLPTWHAPLQAFEVAREAYATDPTPANLALAQHLGELLTNELARPGKFPLVRPSPRSVPTTPWPRPSTFPPNFSSATDFVIGA